MHRCNEDHRHPISHGFRCMPCLGTPIQIAHMPAHLQCIKTGMPAVMQLGTVLCQTTLADMCWHTGKKKSAGMLPSMQFETHFASPLDVRLLAHMIEVGHHSYVKVHM